MLRAGIMVLCLVAALPAGSAGAEDATWVSITGTLVAECGVGSWAGDYLAFHGDFTATGAIEDEGPAYCHAGGTFVMWGAGGLIALSVQAPDTYGIYMQPEGTWTIVYASGVYEGLEGGGTFTAAWPLITNTWEANLYGLEIELEGCVAYVEETPDNGAEEPPPSKPGKGKGKKK